MSAKPASRSAATDVHELEPLHFLEEVHSFEHWFHAVEGYLSGLTYGYRPDITDVPLAEPERDHLISVLSNYCIGETCVLDGASGLIAIAPNRMAKIFLATQVVDEGRHLEVLLHRLRMLGVADPEREVEERSSRSLRLFRRRLLELVASKDWEAAILTQNVILEALEFAVFQSHVQTADPITRDILKGIVKDERRHIGFGENELGRRLQSAPHTRTRLIEVKREMDHLVLETLDETMHHLGLPAAEGERLGRAYLEAAERLGLSA